MSNRVRTVMRRKLIALAVASVAAGSQGAYAQGLEEVIVTAQKREEGLQDVPISVEAFSADQIDNLSAQDIGDLSLFTPNVDISRAANQPRYSIRGIGTSDFGVGADPAVGVYQDGVYIGRSGGSKVAFNDIQRVEILNGPQGTLFGRNAAAGAIQYVTNKPNEETEGWIRGIYGNYDRRQIDGMFNTALTDNLYFRTGLLFNKRAGWIDNEFNGDDLARQDNWSINAQLKWLPTDNLDINFRVEYDEVDQDARPASSAVWGPRNNGAGFDKVENDSTNEETRELFADLADENQQLREVNQDFENSIRELKGQLSEFEQRTQQLAIVAGLEAIDTGQAAGVGGDDLQDRFGTLTGHLDRIEADLDESVGWVAVLPGALSQNQRRGGGCVGPERFQLWISDSGGLN